MRHFLTGYRRHHSIDAEWLARIPLFLKRREIDLYIIIHRSFLNSSARDRTDSGDIPPWPASFMHQRRERIEAETPYIEIDFRGF